MTTTKVNNKIISRQITAQAGFSLSPFPARYERFREGGRGVRSAFTLIELLVVMALTSILLILIFKPLVDSINLTSRAGTSIESQTAAREMMRQISAEMTNAVLIYDNSGPRAAMNIWLYDYSGSAGQLGNPALVQVPYGMVEFVSPARQLDQNLAYLDQNQKNPNPTDPTTGEPIYSKTLPAGERGYALPLERGRTITRYFIGLRDNRSGPDTHSQNGYTNTFDQDPGKVSGMPVDNTGAFHGYANRWTDPQFTSQENRYTLYKAVAQPFIFNSSTNSYIPNLELFHTGPNATTVTDSEKDSLILDDPNFFYDDSLAGPKDDPTFPAGDKHWAAPGWDRVVRRYGLNPNNTPVYRWENWQAVSATMLQTLKADAIAVDRDDSGNILYFDNQGNPTTNTGGRPIVRPLVRFAPTYVENDPGQPTSLQATGAEVPFTAAPAFTMQHAAWTVPFNVLVYRSSSNPPTDPLQPNANNQLTYYQYYVDSNGISHIVNQTVTQGQNPAPPGTLQDIGPQANPNTGFWTMPNPNLQFAFTVDPNTGVVNFAFPQWVLVNNGANREPQRYDPEVINSGIDPNNSPYNVLNGVALQKRYLELDAPLSTANYIYSDPPGTAPISQPLNSANAQSPLGLFPTDPTTNVQPTMVIVPGTERVYGPDQRPGPHYGWRIQYTRLPATVPDEQIGPNQYKINYQLGANAANSSDPRPFHIGYIQFDNHFDTDNINWPNLRPNTDPNSGASFENPAAGVYRLHSLPTLKFDPASNGNVSADPVEVEYQFQMNRPSDVVKADYLTRELMEVVVDTRLYDPATTTAQDTTLTEKLKVRNLQR